MIKITVVSYNNEISSEPYSAVFGREGGTIGRSEDNFFVLQDPKRYVSRLQASIKSDGRYHTITNLSHANPILVNGQEIDLGRDVALKVGDEIQIGLYMLRAELPAAASAPDPSHAPPVAAAMPLAGPGAPSRPDSVALALDLSKIGDGGPDPFADLLGDPAPSAANRAPAATQVAAAPLKQDAIIGFDDLLTTPTAPAAAAVERHAAIIPDDFDPFALPSQAVRNAPDPLAAMSNPDVSLESLAGHDATLDQLMATGSAAAGHTLLDPLDPSALGHVNFSETDPLALFSSDPVLPAAHNDLFLGDVASNHVSELSAHFTLPHARQAALTERPAPLAAPLSTGGTAQPVQAAATQAAAVRAAPLAEEAVAAPPAGPQALPPAPAASEPPLPQHDEPADSSALMQAFLRGANLPMDTVASGLTLEWMEMMGRFVATATQGAVELIASRALVKREVKADVTMIVVRNNNPLKFLPDGQTALIQMLGKKIPGFMTPVEAMQDAYLDLRAHQIGVVAGMRAALDEVLKRFNPERLESKLKTRSLLDSLVAAKRKAKMWDLYTDLFQEIYAEAQDDFQTLFGKAFLQAYEHEIERFINGAQHD